MTSPNWMAAEALIEKRIRDQVKSVVEINKTTALGKLDEQTRKSPCVHLIYDGYRITGERADGADQQIELRWLVVLAVRNARDADTGDGARKEAGELISDIVAALIGWKPSQDHTALKLANAPGAGYTAAFGYFPVAVTTRVHFYSFTRSRP